MGKMTLWGAGEAVDASYKKGIVERIRYARECGEPVGRIAKYGDGLITIHTILDMLEAKQFPKNVWDAMDEALKKMGY